MIDMRVVARTALVVALALPVMLGCSKRATVWVSRQDRTEIEVGAATKLVAATHNGAQKAVGVAEHGGRALVVADVRGGGPDAAEAQAALDALKVAVERNGETIEVSWDWAIAKAPSWAATVHFDIKLPPELDIELKTHNGPVTVRGIAGNCVIETHNGEVTAESTGAILRASTHNGEIAVTTSAGDVRLETHNGGISAAVNAQDEVGGSIVTYNGGVVVALGEKTATRLECATQNGRIHCDHNLDQASVKRTSLRGTIRGGHETLFIQTHNGSIRIK